MENQAAGLVTGIGGKVLEGSGNVGRTRGVGVGDLVAEGARGVVDGDALDLALGGLQVN